MASSPINLNDTVLVLISKKKSPVGMGDLRTIALCNVLYKIIGKVMANRLKTLLPLVIFREPECFHERAFDFRQCVDFF